jgi:hypothetical protein
MRRSLSRISGVLPPRKFATFQSLSVVEEQLEALRSRGTAVYICSAEHPAECNALPPQPISCASSLVGGEIDRLSFFSTVVRSG